MAESGSKVMAIDRRERLLLLGNAVASTGSQDY